MLTLKRTTKAVLKQASRARLAVLSLLGKSERFMCLACGAAVVGFYRYGESPRWGCPKCDSSPRERFVNYAVNTGLLNLPKGVRVLHVAPTEQSLARRFVLAGDVVFGDIQPDQYASLNARFLDLMDLTELGNFGLIYASHVLEHVADDRLALRNIFSQLIPGGEVWIVVPLKPGSTVEGGENMSLRDRETRFGQWDHLRYYGADFPSRLIKVGFGVKVISAESIVSEVRIQCGIDIDEKIFVGTKPELT